MSTLMSAEQERDKRRQLQMEALISNYEQGAIPLGAFLQDLGALIGAFESADAAWCAALKSEWWTIEQVFAASKEPDLRPSEQQASALIRAAIENMKTLISRA